VPVQPPSVRSQEHRPAGAFADGQVDRAEHQQHLTRLISHHVPISGAGRAFQLALTPGPAEKVTVTFND
jgi:hypothetical protein